MNTNTPLITVGASFVALACSFVCYADTIALYDFSEGVVGQPVSTIVNRGTQGESYNGTASVSAGASLTYVDGPRYTVYPTQDLSGEPIVREPKAISFVWDNETSKKGGVVTIPELGGLLAERGQAEGDFTVEFFANYDNLGQQWKDMVGFYASNRFMKYVVYGSNVGLQTRGSNPTWGQNTTYGSWHHFAFTYTGATGEWKIYRDGECFETVTTAKIEPYDNRNFYLGGQGAGSESYMGRLAAVRVSDAVLQPANFMRLASPDAARQAELDGALALWDFAEGTVGESIFEAPNAIDAGDRLCGLVSNVGGSLPTYNADVPGRYLVVGTGAEAKVLSRDIRSAKLTREDNDANKGGGFEVADLRSRFAKAGAFTLEYFFKVDVPMTWCNTFAINAAQGGVAKQLKMADMGSQMATQIGAENRVGYPYNSEAKWHHIALEWDGEKLYTYYDYTRVLEIANVDFPDSPMRGLFGCAINRNSEGLDGKLAGIRIMPRCLEPSEMMYATMAEPGAGPWDEHTVFHWNFENPTAAVGDTLFDVVAAPVNAGLRYGISSCSNSRLPTYADASYDEKAPFVRQGTSVLSENRFCARFYGYSTTHDSIWAGSRIEGAKSRTDEPIVPESFTFEFFVRRDLSDDMKTTSANGQLIAAYGAPTCDNNGLDWMIIVASSSNYSDMRLSLNITDVDGVQQNLSSDEAWMGEPCTTLGDGNWHHMALTYDASTKVFSVYLDRKVRLQKMVEKGLRHTVKNEKGESFVYQLGRGLNTSGFNGWMDEVRLSDCVRPTTDFLKFGGKPGGMVLFFR